MMRITPSKKEFAILELLSNSMTRMSNVDIAFELGCGLESSRNHVSRISRFTDWLKTTRVEHGTGGPGRASFHYEFEISETGREVIKLTPEVVDGKGQVAPRRIINSVFAMGSA